MNTCRLILILCIIPAFLPSVWAQGVLRQDLQVPVDSVLGLYVDQTGNDLVIGWSGMASPFPETILVTHDGTFDWDEFPGGGQVNGHFSASDNLCNPLGTFAVTRVDGTHAQLDFGADGSPDVDFTLILNPEVGQGDSIRIEGLNNLPPTVASFELKFDGMSHDRLFRPASECTVELQFPGSSLRATRLCGGHSDFFLPWIAHGDFGSLRLDSTLSVMAGPHEIEYIFYMYDHGTGEQVAGFGNSQAAGQITRTKLDRSEPFIGSIAGQVEEVKRQSFNRATVPAMLQEAVTMEYNLQVESAATGTTTTLNFEAGLAASRPGTRFTLPAVRDTSERDTAFAIQNPTSVPAPITLTLMRGNQPQGEANLIVGPKSVVSKFFYEPFPHVFENGPPIIYDGSVVVESPLASITITVLNTDEEMQVMSSTTAAHALP